MQTARYLNQVGDRNRFQVYSNVFVCLKWLIISLTVFLPSYLLVIPTFTCGSQTKVHEANACSRISACTIDLPETLTAHLKLYCDRKYIRDSIISSQFVGSVVGLVLLSMLADRLGRKVIIVSTLFMTSIGSMRMQYQLFSVLALGGIYKLLPLLYVGLILMGFGGYSLSMVSYSYLSEINNDGWRQKSLILTYSFWALGEIALYPIIVWISHWLRICLFVFIIPLLLLLAMSYFIVETPEFLYVHSKYQQCLHSLNRIARFNKLPQLATLEPPLPEDEKVPEKITDTFTKPKYLVPLIVLSFSQICNNGLYYTTQYSISELGKSFEFNMLIIGCLEFISCLITNFYCERMYRKRWIIAFMLLSGGIGVLIELTSQSSAIEIVLVGISRLFNTFAFALFSLITTESFPTAIRSTGTGVSEAMSNLGNMGAPFLVTLAGELSVKAVFIGGFVCMAGGVSMLLVRQTKSKKVSQEENPLLEEAVEDAGK